jgi:DNA-directed RNA polymerase specialized sigma24 family protein
MSSPGSVTIWLGQLQAGDPLAAEHLWRGYFHKLVNLAQQRLRGRPPAVADEEDVALSAFDSFCRGARQGQFPRLDDRHDLWQLLVLLTARKVCRLLRDERRLKRGGGAVRHLSALADEDAGMAEVIGAEPTPEFAAEVAEELRRRLEALGDNELRAVAVAKMEGHSNAAIAERLGVTERTVERRLGVLRKLWSEKEGDS